MDGRTAEPNPFVGLIGTMLGAFVLAVVVGSAMRPIAEGLGEAVCNGLSRVDDALPAWMPAVRPADLDIAPGALGYLGALEMAGGQFHFHKKTRDVTWIAVDAWMAGEKVRVAVREYDGPPTTTVTADLLRPVASLVSLVVVRAAAASEIRCRDRASPEGGQAYPVEGGALNLLTSGTLALWIGDGPRHEIEVLKDETIWCTLGQGRLAIDRRESR